MAAARQKQLNGVVVKMKSDKVHERALRLAYPYVGERMVLMVFPIPRPRHNGISSRGVEIPIFGWKNTVF